MTDYRTTESSILFDMLSKFTADYTRLLTDNGSRDKLEELRKEILAIQKEVNYRKKFGNYTDTSNDYITFNDSDIV
jgi:ABC-type uncharacterized transport system fused permease/ATPase subunit